MFNRIFEKIHLCLKVSNIEEINTFIQLGHRKLIRSDSEDFYFVSKNLFYIHAALFLFMKKTHRYHGFLKSIKQLLNLRLNAVEFFAKNVLLHNASCLGMFF